MTINAIPLSLNSGPDGVGYLVQDVPTANFFVNASMLDDTGDGLTPATAKKTYAAGAALFTGSGGEILEIANGTYNEDIDTVPNGAAVGGYNITRAANDGGVLFSGRFNFRGVNYLQFEGLKIDNTGNASSNSVDQSHHMKWFRCSFKGGPVQGNAYIFAFGTNDAGPATEYLLQEDCWYYGVGGRQCFNAYKSDKIIIRRPVMRHDIGWKPVIKNDPEGLAVVYNSNNVEVQNAILIDSELDPENNPSYWVGGFRCSNNADSGGTNLDNYFRGSMIINVAGNQFASGGNGDVENANYIDVVGLYTVHGNHEGWGISQNNPGYKTQTITRALFYNLAGGVALWDGTLSEIDINHSIITSMNNYPVGSPSTAVGTIIDTYNDCFNNVNGDGSLACDGVGTVSVDPETNGLLYPVRIESGSYLETAGNTGQQVGPNIMTKIGVSGTLFGDPGYADDTGESLWPFPNQDRIKTDMSEVQPRGFCVGNSLDGNPQTLTKYIFEQLGNQAPVEVS